MRAIFAKFRCFCHCMPYWNYHISMGHGIQLDTIELRISSSGSSGVIQLLMRSMIPPFAPHVAFCPVRVVIPSVNSKQPA